MFVRHLNYLVSKTHRIRFNKITENALKQSLKNSTFIDMNLIRSQQARQILDMLIGYKISPLLWKYVKNLSLNTLSAGRCQSSALALINDNKELSEYRTTTRCYKTKGNFLPYPYTLECKLSKDFESESEVRDFLELSNTIDHIIKVGSKYKSIRPPPQPLNTSKMIQMSNNLLKLSPTMTI